MWFVLLLYITCIHKPLACSWCVTKMTVLPLAAGRMALWNRWEPTRVSTALRGSSSRRMGLSLYSARARLTLCRWPPLRLAPRSPICSRQFNSSHGNDYFFKAVYNWKSNIIQVICATLIVFVEVRDYNNVDTSVMSPYGSSIISGNKQHASRTALYLVRDACLILEERPKLFLYAWIQLLTFPQCTVFQTGCSPWGSRWGSKPVEQHMRILHLQLRSRREGSSRQKAKNQTYTSAFTLLRRPAGLCPG